MNNETSILIALLGSAAVYAQVYDYTFEDRELEGLNVPFRFGYGIDVSYTLKDGVAEGDYQWITEPGTATIYNYRQTCDIIFHEVGGYMVGVRSTSSCTTPGSYTTMTVSVSSSYMVSSGTGKQVTVSPDNSITVAANQTIAYSLHNPTTGALAAGGRIAVQGGTPDFGSLPAGIYVLSLDTDGGNPDFHKIVLK